MWRHCNVVFKKMANKFTLIHRHQNGTCRLRPHQWKARDLCTLRKVSVMVADDMALQRIQGICSHRFYINIPISATKAQLIGSWNLNDKGHLIGSLSYESAPRLMIKSDTGWYHLDSQPNGRPTDRMVKRSIDRPIHPSIHPSINQPTNKPTNQLFFQSSSAVPFDTSLVSSSLRAVGKMIGRPYDIIFKLVSACNMKLNCVANELWWLFVVSVFKGSYSYLHTRLNEGWWGVGVGVGARLLVRFSLYDRLDTGRIMVWRCPSVGRFAYVCPSVRQLCAQ